jgi:hypothetical protein
MHGVAFPITQLLAGFNLDRTLGNRHAIAQFPAPVVAPIAFTVALSTVPKVQVKQSATSFIHIDKTVNPLMSDGLIGPFQLQALSDLLGAKTLFQPEPKMRVQPYFRLAEFVCTALANVTLLVCQDCR